MSNRRVVRLIRWHRCSASHKPPGCRATRLLTLMNGERVWVCQEHYDAFKFGRIELMQKNGTTKLLGN